ncbi:Poly(ADP-ribose) polymerase catalytic domain protein [compost metagenome]
MSAIETVMLVCTDAIANNNKFWEGSLLPNGDVVCRWGRVGAAGQSKTFSGAGAAFLAKKAAEKRRGGYSEVNVVGSGTKSSVEAATAQAVKKQIESSGDPLIDALLERLVKENRHEIFRISGGQINVSADGVVSTPVGVIDAGSIRAAREVLKQLAQSHASRDFSSNAFIGSLEQYLTLVPQKVAARRGWHTTFLSADDAITRQSSFLDQLEASIELATQVTAQDPAVPKVFDVKLELIEGGAEWKAIEKYFRESLNSRHVSSRLKPVRAYRVNIASMARAFDEDGRKVGNIQRLWHGTRAYNVLSILKQGLIVPKSGGSYSITGRMFGDGLYFSDQSSKSLNYSMGYWDGGSYDSNCFMFLADVAMGRAFTPQGHEQRRQLPARGHDSTFAKAGVSGVQNNEMIVYRTGQANLTTLVEFGA